MWRNRTIRWSWRLALALVVVAPPAAGASDYLEFRTTVEPPTGRLGIGPDVESLAVARLGGLSLIALDGFGRPGAIERIELGPGTHPLGSRDASSPRGSMTSDLLVADRTLEQLLRLRRSSAGWQVIQRLPTGTAPADISQNGSVAVANSGSNDVSLYKERDEVLYDAGRLPTAAGPVAFAGERRDGLISSLLVVAAARANVVTFLGAPDEKSFDVPVASQPSDLTEVDLERREDIAFAVVSAGAGSISILVPTRVRRYGSISGLRPSQTIRLPGTRPVGIATGWLDRDGLSDLAVIDAAGRRLLLLRADRRGTFKAWRTLALPDEPASVLVQDLGGDEVEDVAVVGRTGVVSVFISSEDPLLSDAPWSEGLTANRGRLVWSVPIPDGRYQRDRFKLVERSGQTSRNIPAGVSSEPFRAHLGLGRTGRDAVAYVRCDGPRCAAFTYDFRSAVTRRLPVARRLPVGCRIADAAIWRRTVAYVVDQVKNRRCPERRLGVWLRSGRTERRLGRTRFTRLGELSGRWVSWSEWRGRDVDKGHLRIAAVTSGRARTVDTFDGAYYDLNIAMTGPFIDGPSLYWAKVGDDSASDLSARLVRQKGSSKRACLGHVARTYDHLRGLPVNTAWIDFAIDDHRLYYATDRGVFEAQASRLNRDLRCRSRRSN